ncbi:MAG: hypothetical protein R3C40_11315 [Parvularculaceae bacterium]
MLDLKPVSVPENYDPAVEPLPVVDPITDVANASDDTLEAKIAEYHQKSPFLAVHHNWGQDQLRISKGRFEKVTESVVVLQTLLDAAAAVAPNQELFVEQELFNLTDEQQQTRDAIAIGGSGASLLLSIWAVTRKIDAVAELAPNAGRLARIIHGAKSSTKLVRATRALGAIGAAASLGVGIVSFVDMAETQKRRRAYLESLVNDYRSWFDATTNNYHIYKSAVEELEGEITALQDELGFPPGPAGYDAMVAALAGNIQKLGALTARLSSLLRLLCQQKDVPAAQQLSDAEIAGILSLPETTVANQRGEIASNPNLCNSVLAA